MKLFKLDYIDTYDEFGNYTGREKALVESAEGNLIEIEVGEQIINICNIMKRLNDDKKLSDNGKRIIVSFLKLGGADIKKLPETKE